jgi:hypothetical protein
MKNEKNNKISYILGKGVASFGIFCKLSLPFDSKKV